METWWTDHCWVECKIVTVQSTLTHLASEKVNSEYIAQHSEWFLCDIGKDQLEWYFDRSCPLFIKWILCGLHNDTWCTTIDVIMNYISIVEIRIVDLRSIDNSTRWKLKLNIVVDGSWFNSGVTQKHFNYILVIEIVIAVFIVILDIIVYINKFEYEIVVICVTQRNFGVDNGDIRSIRFSQIIDLILRCGTVWNNIGVVLYFICNPWYYIQSQDCQ